ncbi:hypothetical protein [Chitinophaga nivalis]|uniref:Uncharacterized protein n=1 Tax=Chitinophaga nivalis TaxID=2991709 RepID=A0ABT3IEP5_9BACT|nr:hypothetical protein [Chitinophaga nivalis]MCW3467882.1 hypothetical protein [Chitinophaga nivalis]MCW3482427.1 hypothetical protein [Chitinophaga nivalis]
MKQFLLTLCLVAYRIITAAQQLSPAEVQQIAGSLTDQQLLTPFGREELIRFAQGEPLQVYDGLNRNDLANIRHAVYVAGTSFLDFLPGQTNISQTVLDSISALNRYPWDNAAALAEERFLFHQFPCHRDLYDFLWHIMNFYRYNYASDLSYDTTKALLVKRFGTYFGAAMAPVWADSSLTFDVSPDTDTRALQAARVQAYAPYRQWLHVFQQAGVLPAADSALFHHYSNGQNIYGSLSHAGFLEQVGKRITYLSKYPYLKQQQLQLLDSLRAAGLFHTSVQQQIIARYQPYTLLTANDIFPYCKTVAVPMYAQTDILPYDVRPRQQYGQIDTAAIAAVFSRTVHKISQQLFPINLTDVRVHKIAPDANGLYPYEASLAMSRSAKLLYVTLQLDKQTYREVIDEKEFESWIRPQNFQFLNHYLEDRQDKRRFFYIDTYLFTGYEKQEADTAWLALLTEKQSQLLASYYLLGRLNACYNGSPGDYDYCVFPDDYFRPENRLTRLQTDTFVQRCRQYQVIPHTNNTRLTSIIREQNTRAYGEVLVFSPGYISTAHSLQEMTYAVSAALQRLMPGKKAVFSKLTIAEDGSSGFHFNQQHHHLSAVTEAALFDTPELTTVINQAFAAQQIPYRLYRLPDGDSLYKTDSSGQHNYILLKPAAAGKLQAQYPALFYTGETE